MDDPQMVLRSKINKGAIPKTQNRAATEKNPPEKDKSDKVIEENEEKTYTEEDNRKCISSEEDTESLQSQARGPPKGSSTVRKPDYRRISNQNINFDDLYTLPKQNILGEDRYNHHTGFEYQNFDQFQKRNPYYPENVYFNKPPENLYFNKPHTENVYLNRDPPNNVYVNRPPPDNVYPNRHPPDNRYMDMFPMKPPIDSRSLPTFNGNQPPTEHLRKLEQWCEEQQLKRREILQWAKRSLRGEAALWADIFCEDTHRYEEFKIQFLEKYWDSYRQHQVMREVFNGKYVREGKSDMTSYFLKILKKTKDITYFNREQVIDIVSTHFPIEISRSLQAIFPKSAENICKTLERFDMLENTRYTDQHIHQRYTQRDNFNRRNSYDRNNYYETERFGNQDSNREDFNRGKFNDRDNYNSRQNFDRLCNGHYYYVG